MAWIVTQLKSLNAALYLMSVSIMAGFWGQFFVRKVITILRRASLIVFVLSGVIFASAITMGKHSRNLFSTLKKVVMQSKFKPNFFNFIAGVIGIEKSIKMIHNHEFMGFLDFCSSQ